MNNSISAEESLKIIQNSIAKTKENFQEHSFSFIFWGWLVFGTSLVHYFMEEYSNIRYAWIIWPVVMFSGAIFSTFYNKKRDHKKSYRTYFEEHLSHLWKAIGIGFFVTFLIAFKLKTSPTAVMLLLSGIGVLVTGLGMKFKPFIYGGYSFFIFALISLYVTGAENLIINAIAILVGYLVPGYLLKRK